MKKEIHPAVFGIVIVIILAVLAGLWWRGNQPKIVDHPPVSNPASVLGARTAPR